MDKELIRLEELTPAMHNALDRLCQSKVWADGRSVRALIRRGLAKKHGRYSDALIGSFDLVTPTDKGRQLLRSLAQHKGDSNG